MWPLLKAALLAAGLWSHLGSTQSFPSCASGCLATALSTVGCSASDVPCQCSSLAESRVFESLQTCAAQACTSSIDASVAVEFQADLCLSYYQNPSAYSTSVTKATTAAVAATTTAGSQATTTQVSASTAGAGSGTTTAASGVQSSSATTSSFDLSSWLNSLTSTSGTGFATSTTRSGASATNAGSSTQFTSSDSKSGLSSGAKAGIGIGVALGVVAIIGVVILAFWYGKRSSTAKENTEALPTYTPKPDGYVGGPVEVENSEKPLSEEERAELDRRRRAAELTGGGQVQSSDWVGGSERVELEARRRVAREVYEIP